MEFVKSASDDAMNLRKRSFVTMLCDDSYFNGVSVLVSSLKKHKSDDIPITVIVDCNNVSQTTKKRLSAIVDTVIEVEPLKNVQTDLACPACGYLSKIQEQYGSLICCPVCQWIDDAQQLCNPGMCGGANDISLVQAQHQLASGAKPIGDTAGLQKDKLWRPLTAQEISQAEKESRKGSTLAVKTDPNTAYWLDAPWVASDMTKLRVWQLTQFDVIVYIDADCMVLDCVDELFTRCEYGNEATSNSKVSFCAAPDVFPPDRFNAGVMVLRPSEDTFAAMTAQLGKTESYDGGDTGFLNSIFPKWYEACSLARLPFAYNMQRTLYWFTHEKRPGYWDCIPNKKIVHFSSSPKPWEATMFTVKGDLELLWWRYLLGIPDS